MQIGRQERQGIDGINHLIGLIYEAAVDPSKWDLVLCEMACVFKSHGAVMRLFDNNSNRPLMSVVHGYDERFVTEYHKYFHAIDPSTAYLLYHTVQGQVVSREEAISNREWEDSEYYGDFAHYFAVHKLLGSHFVKQGENSLRLAVQRSKKCPSFSPREKELMALLAPHVQRAYLIGRQMQNMYQIVRVVDDLLERFRQAVFLLDEQGNVVKMNNKAELLVRSDRVFVIHANRLKTVVTSEKSKLDKLLETIVDRKEKRFEGAAIKLSSKDRLHNITVLACPVNVEDSELSFVDSRAAAILFVNDTHSLASLREDILMQLHGLSKAEAKVVIKLVNGHTVSEISDIINVTQNTLRAQLKSIFRKTGAKSQADLVRLIFLTGSDARI